MDKLTHFWLYKLVLCLSPVKFQFLFTVYWSCGSFEWSARATGAFEADMKRAIRCAHVCHMSAFNIWCETSTSSQCCHVTLHNGGCSWDILHTGYGNYNGHIANAISCLKSEQRGERKQIIWDIIAVTIDVIVQKYSLFSREPKINVAKLFYGTKTLSKVRLIV